MKRISTIILAIVLLGIISITPLSAKSVLESARKLPLIYDVDVIVVGDSTGACTAAIEAAQQGAKVFLAASHTYLGSDLCSTYRLWLEPEEQPKTELAKEIFAELIFAPLGESMLPLSYEADLPSVGDHPDTSPTSLLNDGKWHNSSTQSVQYDGNVTLTVDLGRKEPLEKVHLLAYQHNGDFEVDSVTVFVSNDRKKWKQAAQINNRYIGQGSVLDIRIAYSSYENSPIPLSASINETARYLKFVVKKTDRASRVLLAEIIVEPSRSENSTTDQSSIPKAVTPMQVKHMLEQAMLKAGVEFLFGCYGTEVLRNNNGQLAGVVVTNRSGRQAVTGKVIIDATERASLARIAGVEFAPYPSGPQTFKRVVIGGTVKKAPGLKARNILTPIPAHSIGSDGLNNHHGRPKIVQPLINRSIPARNGETGQSNSGNNISNNRFFLTLIPAPSGGTSGAMAIEYVFMAVEYTFNIDMKDGTFASFARAEQLARDMTWDSNQLDSSERLFQVPPDSMKARASYGKTWPGADAIDLNAFRPAVVERLYVLGGCADLTRKAATQLLRPLNLMALGRRIGQSAARQAQNISKSENVHVAGSKPDIAVKGQIRELLDDIYPRRSELGNVYSADRALPVIGEYDVVVIGGGTSGAPAGIGAGRLGAKTIVLEYLSGLGGVGTLGLINEYYYGNRVGFTEELDLGIAAMTGPKAKRQITWHVERKMEWYRRQLRKANVDIWFGVLGSAALVDNNRVIGVVVATPQGRGVVLAGNVIDSTGNAGIAAAAGAECIYVNAEHIGMQGTGMPPRAAGAGYTNTDYTFADDSDVIDMRRAFVLGRYKYKSQYDMGQLIDTRERSRIIGDFFLTAVDMYNRRTFADTIAIHRSNFDSHGFTVDPMFILQPPHRKAITANVPYRCMLPGGLDGILVTGLGISAHRDVMPVIRMQPDVQNQGYAAGRAAAMASKKGTTVRNVNIKALQKDLVEKGNLPKRVLTDEDSFPLSHDTIDKAIESAADDFRQLHVILTDLEYAMPKLRQAYKNATSDKARLAYAHILGIFGDGSGIHDLAGAVDKKDWDKGWNFYAMNQFGYNMSPLDSLLIALGRTGDKRALPIILKKLALLGAKSDFSHYRATAMALESLADHSAAEPLARLLQLPGMTGHAYHNILELQSKPPIRSISARAGPSVDHTTRSCSMIELILARALYRCGDYQGMGEKILKEYQKDVRGPYSRHAYAILSESHVQAIKRSKP